MIRTHALPNVTHVLSSATPKPVATTQSAPPPAPISQQQRLAALANTGNAKGELLLGLTYLDGQGTTVNEAEAARWLEAGPVELDRFRDRNGSALAEDHDGVPVFLARNAWDLRTTIEEWPKLRFKETREQS